MIPVMICVMICRAASSWALALPSDGDSASCVNRLANENARFAKEGLKGGEHIKVSGPCGRIDDHAVMVA